MAALKLASSRLCGRLAQVLCLAAFAARPLVAALARAQALPAPFDLAPDELAGDKHRHEDGAGKAQQLSLIHISEPTRLGMISYAVFCLKKKN